MSTRSRIGIVNEDGISITSIYCHFDGYIEGVGKTLAEHYTSADKVRALMALGDLSQLGPDLGTVQDFDHPIKGTCVSYGRDRGEAGTNACVSANEAEFKKLDEEYSYLFNPFEWGTGLWTVRVGYSDREEKPLIEELKKLGIVVAVNALTGQKPASDSQWIKSLRNQVEEGNKYSLWSPVKLTLTLGDARRLLYILDLERGLVKRSPVYRDDNQELLDELHLLVTGAMEG